MGDAYIAKVDRSTICTVPLTDISLQDRRVRLSLTSSLVLSIYPAAIISVRALLIQLLLLSDVCIKVFKYKKVRFFVVANSPGASYTALLEVLGELHRAQESAYNIRDATRQDYIARAKLCSKLLKYPNVEDYKVNSLPTCHSSWLRSN